PRGVHSRPAERQQLALTRSEAQGRVIEGSEAVVLRELKESLSLVGGHKANLRGRVRLRHGVGEGGHIPGQQVPLYGLVQRIPQNGAQVRARTRRKAARYLVRTPPLHV